MQRFFPIGFEYDDTEDKALRVEAHAMEQHRVVSMRTLPRRLADAIPALRCLANLDEGPNEDNLKGSTEGAPSESAENKEGDADADAEGGTVDVEAPVYEWDELRRTDWIRNHQWWRVGDGAEGRTLEAISVKEGERLQRQILEGE